MSSAYTIVPRLYPPKVQFPVKALVVFAVLVERVKPVVSLNPSLGCELVTQPGSIEIPSNGVIKLHKPGLSEFEKVFRA